MLGVWTAGAKTSSPPGLAVNGADKARTKIKTRQAIKASPEVRIRAFTGTRELLSAATVLCLESIVVVDPLDAVRRDGLFGGVGVPISPGPIRKFSLRQEPIEVIEIEVHLKMGARGIVRVDGHFGEFLDIGSVHR